MIKSIGLDIVDFVKIEKKFQEEKFIEKFLNVEEIKIYSTFTAYSRKLSFVAGRIAAKEAYLKAIGTGIGGIAFKDISFLNDESGKPFLQKPDVAEEIVHVSITHGETSAIAQIIIEEKEMSV